MPPDLLRTALRVLTCYTEYKEPSPQDIRTLRAAVSGPEREWEADTLATYIVKRELERKPGTRKAAD